MQGRGSLTHSAVGFSSKSCRGPTGFGGEARTIPPSGGVLRAQVHRNCSLHLRNVHITPSCPAIEGGEDGGGRGREPLPAPRNPSSSREGSGLGGVHTSSPRITAAWESMAISSGSDSAVATTTEGGSPAKSSSSKDDSPSSDAVIDICSSRSMPN